ncbi:MAG: serine/threonine protein kinase, partial [Melioribacteraceae bacterium]|nr:serine/threonine protein kinase [Melioribacteraceae bacterium]
EYELLRKFDHPNIINVFSKSKILTLENFEKKEFHISDNDKFFVMEYVDGVNIDQLTELKNEAVFLNILDQLSSVLYYLHQANYVYFDLKPENILIISENDKPTVKLIDFGLSSYLPDLKDDFAKGTAEFIAPEILKKEKPDHRADLYSLGILIYKLAYGKFPFSTTNELEIYHAHLEKKFAFPASRYSRPISKVIEKLLKKSPEDRYQSSLEFYKDLDRPIAYQTKLNIKSLFQFIPREKLLNDVEKFLSTEIDSNVLILSGEKGIGKSEILEYINMAYSDSVLINISGFVKSANFWKQFFNKLIYSDFLYSQIDEALEQYISIHIEDESSNLVSEIKSIFAKISKKSKFILIIDDIENTNPRIIETFNELLPILQANNIKIIISKGIDSNGFFEKLENTTEISIEPFSDEEINKLVESSFQNNLPKDQLAELLISYSDRNPNNIANFIFDMVIAGIIDFTYEGTKINDDPVLLKKYLESQELIYDKIYNDLLLTELEVLEVIAIFEKERSIEIIAGILKISKKEVLAITAVLRNKNIIKNSARNINPVFTNDGFKSYIYQKIKDQKALHLKAANTLNKFSAEVNTFILAEQFELADHYDLAIEVIDEALDRSNVKAFPQLMRKLLERKLSYKLDEKVEVETLLKLINIFVDIGEFLIAQTYLKNLENKQLPQSTNTVKEKLLGITLINVGELNEGLNKLKLISTKIEDEENKILFEMASAHLELNNFKETEELCEEIINNEKDDIELLGRVYNLLGLAALYKGAELTEVMNYFKSAHQEYNKINNLMRLAAIEVNIGNISYLMGDFPGAEKHWNKALQINQSIGNVSQEAQILLNYGVFNFEQAKYEEAIDLYQRAGNIFKGLGNKKDQGLVFTNLGETYIDVCEYQLSYDSLMRSQKIFKEINNDVELTEALLYLGKLYWIVGNKKEFDKIVKSLNKTNKEVDESETSVKLLFLNLIQKLDKKFEKKHISQI